jgi:hypothetical protein
MNSHFHIYEFITRFCWHLCKLSYAEAEVGVFCVGGKINSFSDPTLTQTTRRSSAWVEGYSRASGRGEICFSLNLEADEN